MIIMPSMLNFIKLAKSGVQKRSELFTLIVSNMAAAGCVTSSQIPPERAWYLGNESCGVGEKGWLGCSIGPNPPQTWPGYGARRWMHMLCDINSNWVPLPSFLFFFISLIPFSCTGPGQEESSGGDQSLYHPVPGQRGLPDQCLSQQCTPAAGHPGLAAPPHGVLHQPHLTGRQLTYTEITQMSQNNGYPTSSLSYVVCSLKEAKDGI